MYFCENFEMIVKRDGNQGIVFFDSVLCKSKYLRIRLSQYIPLKQGSFSIQNYELRIMNEGRNGGGVG